MPKIKSIKNIIIKRGGQIKPARKITTQVTIHNAMPDAFISPNSFNNGLQAFKNHCRILSDTNLKDDLRAIKMEYAELQECAIEKGKKEEFIDEMLELGGDYIEIGDKEEQILGNVILGKTIKLLSNKDYNDQLKMVETCKKIVSYHERQDNLAHAHEKLHYLINSYEFLGDKQARYKTLKKTLKYTELLLQNYEKYSAKYNTTTSKMQSLESIEIDKAYLHSQIAKSLAHKKRNKAIYHLIEAKKIYTKYGKKRENLFTDIQISRIKTSKMPNKLHEYTTKELKRICNETEKKYRRKELNLKRYPATALTRFEEPKIQS